MDDFAAPLSRAALSPERLFSCADRVALVTGGATGIGRASAEALAAAGARVAIVGLASSRPGAAAAEMTARGAEAIGAESDVTDEDSLSRAVREVEARWGAVDIVVANAGVALDEPGAPDARDRMERMFALHVRAVAHLAELTLPGMAERGGGAFIVMSSLSGLRGNRVLSGYGVTKAANAQLARNLAVQRGCRGVRVNAISPGVIDTEFAAAMTQDPAIAAARVAKTPLGRFGTPAEVAGAVVWLASAAGAFVSGQNIVIDGGTLVSD